MIISLSLQDVTFLLRNKNVIYAFLLNSHTLFLLSCTLPRIELYTLSPRVEFLPQKAIMGLRSPIKKRIRLSDIY